MEGNRKYYGLNASQLMLFYSQKFTLFKQVNNVFTLTLVEEELDFDVLRKAIGQAYATCDTLRIRFTKVGKEIKQYFLEKETPSIKTLDFTGQTREQMDKKLYKLASRPFYVKNRLMSSFYMVRSSEGMTGIYLGVSHLILDSWGICVLIKYIMDTYEALKNGAPMPAPLFSQEQLLIKDLAYRESPQYQRDIEFWQQECTRPEPYFTHINGSAKLQTYRKKKKNESLRYASGLALDTRAKHEVLVIPKEHVDEMKAYCIERNFPMQALFLAAVRTVYSKLNDRQPDITVYTTVARRGTKQEKTGGGTRVHALMMRTIAQEGDTFDSVVEQVHGRQNVLYRHAEFGLLEYLPIVQAAYCGGDPMPGYASVSITFQPVQLTLGEGRICHTKWYCNGAASQSMYITVMDDDGSGALRVYYEYQQSVVKKQTILDFHTCMVNVMLSGVRNPAVTVGELLDMKELPAKAEQAVEAAKPA